MILKLFLLYSVVPRARHYKIPAILPPMSLKIGPSPGLSAHLENLLIIPPANFVCGGYTVFTSVRASMHACIRPSVTLCFLNIFKSHCWIFIKPCKHVHICKTNTLNKKVRATSKICLLYPPQTLFVVGILFSRCPCVCPSVTLCFLNIFKSHCWIFIKPCKHVHICKTNTLNKKVRARGQFY